jgi:hypothetical protein
MPTISTVRRRLLYTHAVLNSAFSAVKPSSSVSQANFRGARCRLGTKVYLSNSNVSVGQRVLLYMSVIIKYIYRVAASFSSHECGHRPCRQRRKKRRHLPSAAATSCRVHRKARDDLSLETGRNAIRSLQYNMHGGAYEFDEDGYGD